jgi:Lrp/AsnC family transcriptional regulator, leucine-responsive regulatory protein
MESITLDATDLALLNQLQADATLSNQSLAEQVHVSPPTCLRRVKRLRDAGLIERQVAILNTDRLNHLQGQGLTVIAHISLDRQGAGEQEVFEAKVVQDVAIQQCYRTSAGADFVLIAHVADMPAWLALTHRLFTSDANVRNVKTLFSVKRAKFEPKVTLKHV